MPVERRRHKRRLQEQANEGLAAVLLAKLGREINIIIVNGNKPLLGDKEHACRSPRRYLLPDVCFPKQRQVLAVAPHQHKTLGTGRNSAEDF